MTNLRGTFTALITPFKNQEVDYSSIQKLVADQVRRGINGFVINGTTAESPTLKEAEKNKIFQFVKDMVPKKFPLIMGTGSNSTEKSIEDSLAAEKIGADALLLVVPYYNKPPQRGLFEHFKAVADRVSVPVILYNVPSRTITSLEIETIKKLSEHPNIIGIKEASGNIDFAKQIRSACGKQFTLLSGDDGSYDEFMKVGGDGVISVASHIIPEAMIQVKANDYIDLINLLFCEANPIPLKAALKFLGIIETAELRLPLVPLAPNLADKLKAEMKKKGVLK